MTETETEILASIKKELNENELSDEIRSVLRSHYEIESVQEILDAKKRRHHEIEKALTPEDFYLYNLKLQKDSIVKQANGRSIR